MPLNIADIARHGGAWGMIASLVESDGSIHHPLLARLSQPLALSRDVADAVHTLCVLHGRYPGVIEHAANHTTNPVATAWLAEAADAFAGERALLVQLVAAAGPLPSTPGQAQSETAIAAQRHALDMLAQSDRIGCAVGAAVALVLDWHAIRAMLDTAAVRFGLPVRQEGLPTEMDTATVIAEFAQSTGAERAIAFGAQQMLAQHRGLWDLLDARASARNH